jgi:Alw26I/Eco31I/Esp3I family type II restriction m6 adenine DNA methyltransferase
MSGVRHLAIAARAGARPDLARRLTGRFYTPGEIAVPLAAAAVRALRGGARAAGDPFCGDGRLVLAWLEVAAGEDGADLRALRRVVLWDRDGEAVAAAGPRVRAALDALGLRRCAVDARAGDTFERAAAEAGTLDLVLTNPPWELLKPDARDGLRAAGARGAYARSLRAYAAEVAAAFPGAASLAGKARAGYGVNLARAGALAALRLLAPGGVLAAVLPASLLADQASAPFRQALLAGASVERVEWYPAEAKPFEGVDQPFVTCVARAGAATARLRLVRRRADLGVEDEREVAVRDPAAPLALSVGGAVAEVVERLARAHPPLAWLEEHPGARLRLGRELDETRIAEAFAPRGEGVPFLKGRHVFPWEVRRADDPRIDPRLRALPASVREPRLAWRDVSRPTQRRRMHVAPVPDGAVTGNSLGIARFMAGPRARHLHALLAVLNGLALEVQVRALLATAHVSQGVLRRCAVPEAAFTRGDAAPRLAALARERLRGAGDPHAVEVELARAFGLSREAFAVVLDAFPKLGAAEREALLARERWR